MKDNILKPAIEFTRKSPSLLVIWGLLLSLALVNFSHHKWKFEDKVIVWDIKSYYAYLPATFIYRDLSLEFRDDNLEKFRNLIWPVETGTGKYAIITSMGLSFLYAPFFFMAHLVSLPGGYEADGYSEPYRFALVFSALFYLAIGLMFLRKVLLRYFTENVTALALLSVVAGTNLYYYSSYEAAMPHSYGFALVAIFLWLTIRWYDKPGIARSAYLGSLAGLIVLIRPTNILILLLFAFWDIRSGNGFAGRMRLFIRKYHLVMIMAAGFILVWIPQFLYWKYVSGHFLYFSYGEAGGKFFWSNPQVFNILFSYKKGWLLYTPLMLFALPGIALLARKQKGLFLPVLLFVMLNIYVLSSWWSWWYGGSYGLRAFIDSYAVMALPLAAVIGLGTGRKRIVRMATVFMVVILVAHNLFQIQQYNNQAIHYWWMNREAYWENFLRLRPTERYQELITIPDYEKAREGIYTAVKPEPERKPGIVLSAEEIIRELDPDMLTCRHLADSLNSLAEKEGQPIDTVWFRHIRAKVQPDLLEKTRKKLLLVKIEKALRNSENMMEYLKEKAGTRGLSLDSMIRLDALWLYNNNQY